MRRLSLLVALLAFAVAGCGAEDKAKDTASKVRNAVDPVALAAEKTSNAGGVRFTMSGKVGLPGAPGGAFPLKGEGTVDQKELKGTMSFSFDIPQVGRTKIEQILAGSRIYMRSDQFDQVLPDGKRWLMIDLQKLGKEQGIDFGALMSQSSVDPAEVLGYLRSAGDVREAGTEKIRGQDTRKYETKIDLRKALKAQGSNAVKKGKVETLLKQTGLETLPVTVFIGDDDLVRRMVMKFKSPVQQGSTESADFNFTIDYLEYGKKVSVDPPDRDEVVDIAELAAASSGVDG